MYADAQVSPEGLIWIDGDMTGCDAAIAEATKSGDVRAAVFGASYFSVYKNDDRKYLYYLRRAVELGDNESTLELAERLLYSKERAPGDVNAKNSPEVLGLLKRYKVYSLTPNDESTRDYYERQKWHFDDARAACNPSSSKAKIGSGGAANEQ